MQDRQNGHAHNHEKEIAEAEEDCRALDSECEHGCPRCQTLWGCIGKCNFADNYLVTCPACVVKEAVDDLMN